jgi:hypothetical protein
LEITAEVDQSGPLGNVHDVSAQVKSPEAHVVAPVEVRGGGGRAKHR